MKRTIGLAFGMAVLAIAGTCVVAPGVRAEEATPVSMDDLLLSEDIVLTPSAMTGGAVEIVARPEEVRGGVTLKQKIGILISSLVKIWKTRPIDGLELLPRDLIQRLFGSSGGTSITNAEFTTDLSGWTSLNAYAGASAFGTVTPAATSTDNRFAVTYSGTWDAGNQGYIEQTFHVNTPKNMTFSVLYNFITTEINAAVGGSGAHFNDNALVTLTHADGTVQFGLFESVNSSTLIPVSGLPNLINAGRGQTGGQTGWITKSSDVLSFDAGDYTVRIEVNDVSDFYGDSAMLVDMVGLQ